MTIKNLRLFGDAEQEIVFDSSKNVAVILGDNGAGKTSLLYGCTVLLSQFYEHFPECSKKQFIAEDIRNVSNEKKADYLHVGMELEPSKIDVLENVDSVLKENNEFDVDDEYRNGSLSTLVFNPQTGEFCVKEEYDNKIGKNTMGEFPLVEVDMYLKGNNTKSTPSSQLKAIKDYSLKIKTKIDNGEKVALPVIAYYGTERGQIKPVERRRNFTDIFPRWDIYKSDSLDSATDFKRFFTWFERNEDMERRERDRRKDFGYTSPVLDVVRKALNQLFEHLNNPRVEVSPLRFVMDDISDPVNPIEKRIERMSDGYRIMVALVADIASRMAEGNPSEQCSGIKDPLDGNGIVLIDEIDLHLHPKLQRVIIGKLTKIFPNVQFIVSTHSPNVVIGALDFVQIVKLDHGRIDSQIRPDQYDKYDISLLLLSDLFGVDNVRTQEFKNLEEEEDKLLAKDSLSEEELARLKELAILLRAYGYSDGKGKI